MEGFDTFTSALTDLLTSVLILEKLPLLKLNTIVAVLSQQFSTDVSVEIVGTVVTVPKQFDNA